MTTRTATKRPDDTPFDFNLDTVQAEAEMLPFRVHFAGRRFELTHVEELDVWKLLEGADSGEVGAMLSVFRAALGDDWPEFRKQRMPQWKLKKLFDAYKAHCGLGESEASSDS